MHFALGLEGECDLGESLYLWLQRLLNCGEGHCYEWASEGPSHQSVIFVSSRIYVIIRFCLVARGANVFSDLLYGSNNGGILTLSFLPGIMQLSQAGFVEGLWKSLVMTGLGCEMPHGGVV